MVSTRPDGLPSWTAPLRQQELIPTFSDIVILCTNRCLRNARDTRYREVDETREAFKRKLPTHPVCPRTESKSASIAVEDNHHTPHSTVS